MYKKDSRKLNFLDLMDNVESLMYISEPEDIVNSPTYILCNTRSITQNERDFLENFDVEEEEYDEEKTKFTFPIGFVIDLSC